MKGMKLVKKIGMSSLILMIPLLIVTLNLKVNGSVDRGGDALYIYHLGDTDKAVLPVVIASQKPSEENLESVFGEYEWEEASFYKVDPKDLKKLFSSMRSFFDEQKKDDSGHAFGTFRITVSDQAGKESRIFPPGKFMKIINSFSKLISGKYEGLSDRFSSYRSRIRVR